MYIGISDTKMWWLIGLAIVVILAGAWYYQSMPKLAPAGSQAAIVAPTAKWAIDANTNYVWGMVNPAAGSADGNVAYLGLAQSADECKSLCATKPLADCGGYTWNDGNTGPYAKMCYGLKTVGAKVPEPNHQSATRSEGFASNLMQLMGMQDAGEKFENDTLKGTFSAGYPQTVIIPSPY